VKAWKARERKTVTKSASEGLSRYRPRLRQQRYLKGGGMKHAEGERQLLPDLVPMEDWTDLPTPRDLLPEDRRERLQQDLDDIVRKQRQAEARASSLRLS
jgi:hypothetical protein